MVFFEDKDKSYYSFLLHKFKGKNNISIFHYCLMNNHVHLILWVNKGSCLAKYIKQVNLSYFHFFKNKYGYVGHFWQNRYKSSIIDTDHYLLQCGKYIELNPVRAGIVISPEEYRFSSYHYYAAGAHDPLITPNPVYLETPCSEEKRLQFYKEFVISSSMINSKILNSQSIIGSEDFIMKTKKGTLLGTVP